MPPEYPTRRSLAARPQSATAALLGLVSSVPPGRVVDVPPQSGVMTMSAAQAQRGIIAQRLDLVSRALCGEPPAATTRKDRQCSVHRSPERIAKRPRASPTKSPRRRTH